MISKARFTVRMSMLLFLIGFPLSFVLEYFQMPLFRVVFVNGFINSRISLSILSTLLDVISVFAIYFLMVSLFGKAWAMQWSIPKAIIIMICGMVLVVAGERSALALGIWNYSNTMPVIPVLGIGITPFLIIALVPLVTMYTASKLA